MRSIVVTHTQKCMVSLVNTQTHNVEKVSNVSRNIVQTVTVVNMMTVIHDSGYIGLSR